MKRIKVGDVVQAKVKIDGSWEKVRTVTGTIVHLTRSSVTMKTDNGFWGVAREAITKRIGGRVATTKPGATR